MTVVGRNRIIIVAQRSIYSIIDYHTSYRSNYVTDCHNSSTVPLMYSNYNSTAALPFSWGTGRLNYNTVDSRKQKTDK